MAKLKNRKPLQKYQTGGDTNDPWGFMGSGLSNPASFDISSALTGRGTLNISTPGQNSINFGDNPFGAQLMSGTLNTARSLGSIPGMSQMNDPMPEWGDEESERLRNEIAKEKGLIRKERIEKDGTFKESKVTWTDPKTGEKFTKKDLDVLAGQRYDAEKEKRAQFKKMEPMLAPLLQLNELGEMQKNSYAQAQKESMYDVTKSPLSMESKGFFAKEGMRTPPVAEVYRMMGAHQGLPETSYKLAKTLDFKSAKQKDLNDLLEQIVMEEGGNVGYSNVQTFQNSGQVKKNNEDDSNSYLQDLEINVNKKLGYPMDRAFKASEANVEDISIDNLRHSLSGLYTSQAIQNKFPTWTKNTGLPQLAGFLGSNILGAGHELMTLIEDERPLKQKVVESIEDVTNNFVGSILSTLPFMSPDERENTLRKLSASNLLPDGFFQEDQDFYIKEQEKNLKSSLYKDRPKKGGNLPGVTITEKRPPSLLPEVVITAKRNNLPKLILNQQQGGNVTSAINEIENLQKTQNNMYNNNQRISRLAMMLGGGLIRGYQEGGVQQPMSPEEEQMMMEQAMQQEMAMQQGQQQPMPQQGGGMEGQPQQGQPQPQPGENKYMQLPPEQQVEVYKQIIDFVMQNGIDTLEQQYPEEYQFFEEFSDMLEGEDMEGEEEEMGGEMETEAGRMEMGGGEEMYGPQEEMEQEYPTDEEEVPVGARPGENAMRPAQEMKEGGIPQRYRNMGYNKVGQKRQSDRPGKKWSVLAKKGDKYKIVHGGAVGMDDFKQHGNKERQKRFWDRMGGRDSAKANDPFSPLYWHKRFGTW
jgi:hypothetical protein